MGLEVFNFVELVAGETVSALLGAHFAPRPP